MKSFLKKITPVYVVCLSGIIYFASQFFILDKDYNIFAYLIIFIVFLSFAFVIDRFLVTKISYKKLFIAEFILLISVTIWYIYSTSYTEINIETSKPYFFVIYNDDGLKKADIPSTGLFNKSIVIKSDSNIYIANDLQYSAQINPPKSWNGSYSSNKIEKTINGKKITIQIFAGNTTEKERNQLLEIEAKKLEN